MAESEVLSLPSVACKSEKQIITLTVLLLTRMKPLILEEALSMRELP